MKQSTSVCIERGVVIEWDVARVRAVLPGMSALPRLTLPSSPRARMSARRSTHTHPHRASHTLSLPPLSVVGPGTAASPEPRVFDNVPALLPACASPRLRLPYWELQGEYSSPRARLAPVGCCACRAACVCACVAARCCAARCGGGTGRDCCGTSGVPSSRWADRQRSLWKFPVPPSVPSERKVLCLTPLPFLSTRFRLHLQAAA